MLPATVHKLLALSILALPATLLAAPTLSNVSLAQESNGSGGTRVRLTYDIASSVATSVVSLQLSTDGGATFPTTPTGLTGDVGAAIAPGTGKVVDWDIAAQFPAQALNNVVLRIVAEDSTSDLAITNAGFESATIPSATVVLGAPSGWTIYNPAGIHGGTDSVGAINPAGTTHFIGVPQGSNASVVFLSDAATLEAGLEQTLSATAEANRLYTLNVQVGNINEGTANFGYFNLIGFPGYRVELRTTGGVIASDNNTIAATIPEAEFRNTTLQGTVAAGNPLIGQALTVRLVNLDIPGTVSAPGIEVNFDDIRLKALGFGASSVSSLETIAPTPGTSVPPASTNAAPIAVPYSGAVDTSGLASVELWVRTDTTPWSATGLTATAASGSFNFTPSGSSPANHGNYYFALVAEDTRGNRSAEPSGLTGTGDGVTSYNTTPASVPHWQEVD